jgi:uncharacterized protein (TIGR03437 family)
LKIAVETAAGTSNLLKRQMRGAAPGIFTVGAGKALAVDDSGELSQIPTPSQSGLPVLPGEVITIRVTGVSCDATPLGLQVAGRLVEIQSIAASSSYAGVCEIAFQIPNVSGDSLPVALEAIGSDGQSKWSNQVTVGVAK